MHVFTTFLCLDVVYANVFRNSTIILRHTSKYMIYKHINGVETISVTRMLTSILVKKSILTKNSSVVQNINQMKTLTSV